VRLSPRLLGVCMATLAAAALALAAGRSGSQQRVRPVAYANGILSTSTSGDGDAILSASGFAPGHVAHGQVTVDNDSSSQGSVGVDQTLRSEAPGDGGGRLYDDLNLTIRQTNGTQDGLVYSGPMSVMGSTTLKSFRANEERSYSFAVSMPDNGTPGGPAAGDNSLQGGSVSVDFVWTANALSPSAARGCRHGELGTPDDDSLVADRHGSRILGRAGNDRIRGGRARDCVYGGRGNDALSGGPGADRLRGGYDDDTLRGGAGNDSLRGRQGDDRIVGGPGRDSLRGTSGNDWIDAADGQPDRVRCGIGRDVVIADPTDQITGCERILR
jgi:Ca2+-binding RTX toxin-like protein